MFVTRKIYFRNYEFVAVYQLFMCTALMPCSDSAYIEVVT